MEPPNLPADDGRRPPDSPAGILARIDAREREIERALHEARETAAALVLEARKRGEQIATARRDAAAREAAELGARVVAGANRSAEEIAAGAGRAAAAVRGTPAARIERAAAALLAVVLPAGPAEGDGR
ncbi:MAG TPA: hypothetical protein VN317_06950 [Candidatus Methanoperedens sp.]|nr:hypothetical protein [Candidatus Methanoperedens sp.]